MLAFDNFADEMQWRADTIRLLRIALLSHDRELLADVHLRICERYTPRRATTWLSNVVCQMIATNDWSFEEESTEKDLAHV